MTTWYVVCSKMKGSDGVLRSYYSSRANAEINMRLLNPDAWDSIWIEEEER